MQWGRCGVSEPQRKTSGNLVISGKTAMSEPILVSSATGDVGPPTRSFRPDRSRIWGIGAAGVLFAVLAIVFVLLPLIVGSKNGAPAELDWIAIITGLLIGGFSAWMLLLAWQLARMRVIVSPEHLDLRARRYEWRLTNPFGSRRVLLDWPQVQGLRRWRTANPFAPGGVQENYVLYTNDDKFVLSNLDWPEVSEMANLIGQISGRPIAAGIAELPRDLKERALPSRTERAKLRIVHAFGWLAIVSGVLLLVLAAVWLLGGGPLDTFIITLAVAAYFLFLSGQSMRRFHLE